MGGLSTWFSSDTEDGGEVSYSRSHAQFWGGMDPPGFGIGVLYQGDYRNEETGIWRWADSQILLYDTRNDEMIQSLLHLPPLILGFTFSPDGEAFVLAAQDGGISLWETASAVPLRTVMAYDVNTEPQISPDGRRVAYSYHSSARVFSASGELQQEITPTHGTLDLEVRFVDADRLALFYLSISGDYVEIWDLDKAEIAYIAPYVLGPCDFTVDGHTMICHQPSTRFIDTRTGEKLMDVGEASYGRGRYAFSPDDRYIAYCGIDWPTISLFKRSTGKYLGRFTADAPTVCGNVAFSPDSARLASAAGFVWNVSSLRLAFAFDADPELAQWTPLAYGPQGDIFFVGGNVFDAATGNKLANLPLGGQSLYFGADGTRLVAVSNREWSIWTVAPLASAPPEWNLTTTTEGWQTAVELGPPVITGGILVTHSTGTDPQLYSVEGLHLDANKASMIEIRMRILIPEPQVRSSSQQTLDRDWSESKSRWFMITPDGQFHDYTIYVSLNAAWRGTIRQLRLDPTDQPATIEIDYIRLIGQ